jgi:hypothetical protein
MAIAADVRITSVAFNVRLGPPVLRVVALSRIHAIGSSCLTSEARSMTSEISLPPAAQSEPLFGPFGPSGRPRGPLLPSNCAKFAGVGAPPPLHTPAPLRGALPGWLRPPEAQNISKSSMSEFRASWGKPSFVNMLSAKAAGSTRRLIGGPPTHKGVSG